MGLYKISLPVRRDYRPKQGGVVGSFLLGLFFGVVSSPCATPVLVVLLTYVATKGKVVYGTTLLFTYAVGHCMLMLAAGTFTGFIESFVKARGIVSLSAWTSRAGGFMVAAVGIYLLWSAL
jgi:cytochrome c biogenesis protein CcdA